ncbi:hypothetical protein EYB26_005090 [Talaromyces marneffei]|uniref:uncharacterized protein n=1 Tax=Talaromyces marneffei TaxID=37727 RepID=UPI0012A947EF|nr:uncharacterized protein EYB26_005090 [Talaromyces marneffei]QGA17419.1 hypothetical protein EYB26_005090 [Talaromyces marneffei]
MPPIRNKKSKDLIEQEGRILLAISDFQNGKIPNIAQAAEIYNIPRTTLRNRLHGTQQRLLVRANSHKLTQPEEESLVKWVLDLDRRGLPHPPGTLLYEKWLIIFSHNMEINRLERNGCIILLNVARRLIQSSHEDTTTNVLNAKIQR